MVIYFPRSSGLQHEPTATSYFLPIKVICILTPYKKGVSRKIDPLPLLLYAGCSVNCSLHVFQKNAVVSIDYNTTILSCPNNSGVFLRFRIVLNNIVRTVLCPYHLTSYTPLSESLTTVRKLGKQAVFVGPEFRNICTLRKT